MFQQENDMIMERFLLSMERIRQIELEETVAEPFRDYFNKTAGFIVMIGEYHKFLEEGKQRTASIEELKEWNHKLYDDILPGHYDTSYANPQYAESRLSEEYGQILAYLYKEIRGDIVFVQEHRLSDVTILNELLIEIYNRFEEEKPEIESVKEIIYWFVSDYTDHTVSFRVREGLDPSLSFAVDIIKNHDLNDLRYLYYFGEYISDSERKVAEYLNSLSEDKVRLMADTYTQGYQKGFKVMGRDLSKKRTVQIRYELGFERMIKFAIENFEKMGLEVILCRAAVWAVNTNAGRKAGYFSKSPNRQYDYDHRYDNALFLNKAFKDRKSTVLKVAYESCKELAEGFAGPAVIETFGREGFQPLNKPEANRLDSKQEKLALEMSNETSRIVNQYVPGDETSFTIIAFPVPEIGDDFEEIFDETIAINTLDYETYKGLQQTIIDTLDQSEYVEVSGKGKNKTRLTVALHSLKNPEKETNFENCVADVNIPLGEVFTSPKLTGTKGVLFVSTVYIADFQFKDLTMKFENGMITDYSCSNFEDPEEGKSLIKQVILKNHQTLPMGEFAIGTNTTAYSMAQKFNILDKLPILIVEKMGPHFAVGDTCYSWSEDSPVYNPNGKEIIARDNEVSLLRKEDVSKAYFSCHTDITIPYSELDKIEAVSADGTRVLIIDNGRFVLKGTETLNLPLTDFE